MPNDSTANTSTFFDAHGLDVDDLSLDKSDIIPHLMNGYCAESHDPSMCRGFGMYQVTAPVKMAIAVIIEGYSEGELSSENLRSICSAVGIQPDRGKQEGANLIGKLKVRCDDLRRLLGSTKLSTILDTVEEVGK